MESNFFTVSAGQAGSGRGLWCLVSFDVGVRHGDSSSSALRALYWLF